MKSQQVVNLKKKSEKREKQQRTDEIRRKQIVDW